MPKYKLSLIGADKAIEVDSPAPTAGALLGAEVVTCDILRQVSAKTVRQEVAIPRTSIVLAVKS